MTKGMVGSDPTELDRLGQEMVRAAENLERSRQRMQRAVLGLTWNGAAADRLRREHVGIGLGPLVDLLRTQGAVLREQASQQEQASRASGGSAAGAGGPPVAGSGPGPNQYSDAALRNAGIDPATWRPELGFDANRATIEKVYDYYAQLYLAHPELQWAGMAALIGPSFEAGFSDLDDMRAGAAGLAAILATAQRSGAILPPDVSRDIDGLRALANASDHELRFYETTMLDMQRQIFLDQGTQHEAFLQGGLPAIHHLHDAGKLDDRTMHAWELIDRGRHGDGAALAEGNRLLLLREQTTTIDDEYQRMLNHDPPVGRGLTYLMTAVGQPSIDGAHSYAHVDPLTLAVSSPGTIGTPHSILGHDIPHVSMHAPVQITGRVETPLPNGNIANFDDRWRLIEQDTLPAYQKLLAQHRVDDILLNTTIADRYDDFRLVHRIDDLGQDLATNWHASVGVSVSLP